MIAFGSMVSSSFSSRFVIQIAASRGDRQRAAIDDVGVLAQQLDEAPVGVERPRHEHQRRHRLGLLDVGLELLRRRARRACPSSGARARRSSSSLPRFGASSRSASCTTITRRGAIIGSVRAVDSSDADQLIAARRVRRFVGVEALDVERLQAFVDDVRKLDGEVVARLQIVALEQVERPGLAALDLFADFGDG